MSEDTQLTDNRTHERAKKGLVYLFYFFVLTFVDVLSWPLLDRLGHRAWPRGWPSSKITGTLTN